MRPMKVADIGEFGLIDDLARQARARTGAFERLHGVTVGIGDDAAAWQADGVQLATTDTLVEGVHFRRDLSSWPDLGWKALAVNLSDIAAMGGVPQCALVTLALPSETSLADMSALYDGLCEAAETERVAIVGGDVVGAPVVVITVTLFGTAGSGPDGGPALMLRSAARPGDLIAVTGVLGGSAAGLAAAVGKRGPGAGGDLQGLLEHHRRPRARVREGQVLLACGVVCAIDVSDGLAADLGHICEMSHLSAEIHAAKVPVHPVVARLFPDDALHFALSGGEDYELLFTAPAQTVAAAKRALGESLTIIGEMTSGEAGKVRVLDEVGKPLAVAKGGWDHFAS